MEKEYRIVKVTYSNGIDAYIIQRKRRFLIIGPYIWETYWIDYPLCDIRWSYFLSCGDYFSTFEEAAEELKDIKMIQGRKHIIKKEVINYE